MPDGMTKKIGHILVGTSKEALGVWTVPYRNAKGALMAMHEKAQEWVDKAKEGN